MATKKALVIGDINIDFAIHSKTYPAEGGEAHAEQADFRLGGSGCITAACLQLLGVPTALAANTGADLFGQFAWQHLNQSELDLSLVTELTGQQTGFFMILVTSGGQRTMFGNRGANAQALDSEKIVAALAACDHLHVSGYTLLGDAQYQVVRDAMVTAHNTGLSVSLDPGVCTSEQAADRVLDLLGYVDYFLPSQDELKNLVKDRNLDEQIAFLLDHGCRVVALKQGSQGSTFYSQGKCASAAAVANAESPIVDSTGAGDCFNAGFLAGVLENKTAEEALLMGNRAAFRIITSQHGIADLINEK